MRGRRWGFSIGLLVVVVATGVPRAAAQTPQPVSLEEAVASALDRHPSVTAAAKAVDAAQARLVQAQAGNAVQVAVNSRASVGTLSSTGSFLGSDASASHNVSV
ncbi:MAG: TolC family protein, partial [Armatimonadetes bacterium]|nr:TolC family protein [Armatimonadota bacterium]